MENDGWGTKRSSTSSQVGRAAMTLVPCPVTPLDDVLPEVRVRALS